MSKPTSPRDGESPQEFLMRTLSPDQWRVVADALRMERLESAREAKREVAARVSAVVDDPNRSFRNAVLSDDLRAALRGDA